jgi:hypothetical protein
MLSSIDARIQRLERMESGPDVDGRLVRHILQLMEKLMATIDETLAAVTRSGDRLDSLIVYVEGLRAQLDEALKDVSIPPDVQAKIDAIFQEAEENVAKTDRALNTNVPPATPVDTQ